MVKVWLAPAATLTLPAGLMVPWAPALAVMVRVPAGAAAGAAQMAVAGAAALDRGRP